MAPSAIRVVNRIRDLTDVQWPPADGQQFAYSAAQDRMVPLFSPVAAPASLGSPLLLDSFQRADTAVGAVGSPDFGPAWTLYGNGAPTVQVQGKRLISPIDTTYVYSILPSVPRHFGGIFTLGTSPNQLPVQASTAIVLENDTSVTAQHMLHTVFNPTGIGTTIWLPGSSNVYMAGGQSYASVALQYGRPYRADLWLDLFALALTVSVLDLTTGLIVATYTGTDPAIPQVAGPLMFIEPDPGNTFSSAYAYGERSLVGPWKPLPLATGFAPSAATGQEAPRARLEEGGQVVRMSGMLTNTAAAAAGVTAFTLPVGIPPPAQPQLIYTWPNQMTFTLSTTGLGTLDGAVGAGSLAQFDSVTYPLN